MTGGNRLSQRRLRSSGKGFHEPPPFLKPKIPLVALDDTGVAITDAAYIGGSAAHILDPVDLIDMPLVKHNLQRT